MTRTSPALFLTLGMAVLAGCAGEGPPPNTGGAAYEVIQREIFDVHCLGGGCHNSDNQAGGLVLVSGVSFSELVNVVPENPSARDEGLLRVTPFEPDNSFILIKLTGPPPAQGTQMPQGMPPLADDEINLIRDWIVAGAQPPPTSGSPATTSPTPTVTPTAPPLATDTPVATATQPQPPSPTTGSGTSTPTAPVVATTTPTASASPSSTVAVTFEQIQTEVFTPNCLGLGCHNSTDRQGNLILEAGSSFNQLVGVEPFNVPAREDGLLRVAAGDTSRSLLLIKLQGPPLEYGSRMPLSQLPLSPALIQMVSDWIAQGANP